MSVPLSNMLLDSIPYEARKRLVEQGVQVSLPAGRILYKPGTCPRFAHFITSGISSIIVTMTNGTTSEVGLVGREGLPQAGYLIGTLASPAKCVMQTPGTCIQIDFNVLKRLYLDSQAIQQPILSFLQYQSFVSTQLTACNRIHTVQQRLARWLLMIHDRLDEPILQLTQEYLSDMIGSQRTTVSDVAGALQKRGFIQYSRGVIRILDPKGLKSASCECYPVVRELHAQLCGTAPEEVHSSNEFSYGGSERADVQSAQSV
jgi:CRP-like cAMP-binding protein